MGYASPMADQARGREPREKRFQRKEPPAACPFCKERIPRPALLNRPGISDGCEGGACGGCGAVFIGDVTGKLGGQALVDGLTILADGDVQAGMSLQAGVDYEMHKVGYRPRTHSLEKHMPRHATFGRPKLWFFRALPAE